MKVFCLNKISKKAINAVKESVVTTVDDADSILVRSAKMHEMVLPKNVLAVARAGAGVNNIPLQPYALNGVVVFNTPGANANAVKELALCGLFLGSRDVIGGVNWVQENKADPEIAASVEANKSKFGGFEIKGKTIGIIGLGIIGVLVANACKALGMKVIGYDPFLSLGNAMRLDSDFKYVSKLEDIYKNSDYISIHVPLNGSTKGMINAEAFKQMKNGVVFLNFARDALVNDIDLADALASKKVSKYITDFPNATVVNYPNVITVPHLGASTEEAEDNSADMAINQLVDFLENGNIKNSVNYPAVDLGPKGDLPRICICHKNVPGMISQFTDVIKNFANIPNMVNKSLGEFAYTLLEVETNDFTQIQPALEKIEGVLRVRVIC